MKALVFHGAHDVRVDTVPDPILPVTATASSGSDLHIFNGFFPQPRRARWGRSAAAVGQVKGRA